MARAYHALIHQEFEDGSVSFSRQSGSIPYVVVASSEEEAHDLIQQEVDATDSHSFDIE